MSKQFVARPNRGFEFHKPAEFFVCVDNEPVSVPTMRVHDPDRSPLGINRSDAAPTPTGFAEIVRYKKEIDASGTLQFGLVAKDVADIDADLVTRDSEGKPETVRYEAVNAMLLNEFLKEHRKVEQQRKDFDAALGQQQKQIHALAAIVQKVSAELELNKSSMQTVLNNQ